MVWCETGGRSDLVSAELMGGELFVRRIINSYSYISEQENRYQQLITGTGQFQLIVKYMDFLKRNYEGLKKKTMHWINPNQNPTNLDKYAFQLLEKAEVDLFIQFMDKNEVNIHVIDISSASLLIKAQGIPTYRNDHTKNQSEDELEVKAVKAIQYLLDRGIDINYRNKNGFTALLSASHWGYEKIVECLLKRGADPNIGSNTQGFQTNPLLSAVFKDNVEVLKLLLLYGADPAITEQINSSTTGWRINEEQISRLYSLSNVVRLTAMWYREHAEGKETILTTMSSRLFNELLECA